MLFGWAGAHSLVLWLAKNKPVTRLEEREDRLTPTLSWALSGCGKFVVATF